MIPVRDRYRHIARYYDRAYRLWFAHGSKVMLGLRAPIAGESVLEIGTGTGFSYRHYAAGVKLIAVDVCAEMLAIAARKVSQSRASVHLAIMDGHSLALRDRSFDLVMFAHSLGLMDDPLTALAEAARVTRPGAELRVLHTFVFRNRWLRRVEMALYDFGEHRLGWGRPLDLDKTVLWCRKNGFELERRRRVAWKLVLCFRRCS